ncbi:hypothetical protein GKJPGBOP_00178 [Streptomyces paromomycinus]|uniref:Metallo-beta-lactamase domain-containing protein n=1 Tax=Streptomyces paromomycinus TaxID=92743 RepID=A0A401VTW1_STREY|nr:hypothetical protein GKJPGBOP_00178 [Streptomyces paromomycinus]
MVTHLHTDHTDHADPVAIRKALAPVNGPVVELPHLQPPSPFNAATLPEEAAVAAHILGARIAVPLHYGTLNKAPIYVETPRAVERFEQRARELGIAPLVVPYGEWFEPSVAPVR